MFSFTTTEIWSPYVTVNNDVRMSTFTYKSQGRKGLGLFIHFLDILDPVTTWESGFNNGVDITVT